MYTVCTVCTASLTSEQLVLSNTGQAERIVTTMNRAALCPHESWLAPIEPSTKLVLGVKRPVREAGHLSSSSVKVKNELNFTSTPHMRYGVKSDDGFTFSLCWILCIFFLKKETVSFCETFAISPDDRQCPKQ